jgi:hypothetical protein
MKQQYNGIHQDFCQDFITHSITHRTLFIVDEFVTIISLICFFKLA